MNNKQQSNQKVDLNTMKIESEYSSRKYRSLFHSSSSPNADHNFQHQSKEIQKQYSQFPTLEAENSD